MPKMASGRSKMTTLQRKQISVPSTLMGAVIGRGGNTIRTLQRELDVRIQYVNSPNKPLTILNVQANLPDPEESADRIAIAERRIQQILARAAPPPPRSVQPYVPFRACGKYVWNDPQHPRHRHNKHSQNTVNAAISQALNSGNPKNCKPVEKSVSDASVVDDDSSWTTVSRSSGKKRQRATITTAPVPDDTSEDVSINQSAAIGGNFSALDGDSSASEEDTEYPALPSAANPETLVEFTLQKPTLVRAGACNTSDSVFTPSPQPQSKEASNLWGDYSSEDDDDDDAQ